MTHVLIVDDSAMDRAVVGKLVETELGYQVEYATNGVEALEVLEARLPVVVVTDLLMPEMDGMQLVEAMRQRFPTVPVILMTQGGSEELALKALIVGASDFVPKPKLRAMLRQAIEAAVALAGGDRAHDRLHAHCERVELRYRLENDLELIPPMADRLRQEAAALGVVDEADGLRFAKAVAEALRNAICHGNLELTGDNLKPDVVAEAAAARRQQAPYAQRRVAVTAVITCVDAMVTVADEGLGLPPSARQATAVSANAVIAANGRGLLLIRTFVDEVHFNDSGNVITLVKRRDSRPAV